MRCELPILTRCCFCFPLRYGLLAWAYISQITSILLLTNTIWNLCARNRRWGVFNYVVLSILLVSTISNIAFNVLFIISAHTKDYRKMRIFYRYSIVMLCLYGAVFVLLISNIIYTMYTSPYFIFFLWYMLPLLISYLLLLICQGYLIILVRSEFIKLKSNSQFEFVNNAPEEKCTANFDFECPTPV